MLLYRAPPPSHGEKLSCHGKYKREETGSREWLGSRLQDPWRVLRGVKAVVTGIHAVSTYPQFEPVLLFPDVLQGVDGGFC